LKELGGLKNLTKLGLKATKVTGAGLKEHDRRSGKLRRCSGHIDRGIESAPAMNRKLLLFWLRRFGNLRDRALLPVQSLDRPSILAAARSR
jgi:hypothetical protein